eukprot:Partr_v1_DN28981_c0_g1_i5_m25133 putative Calcium channel, voltage-dependent
MYDTSFFVFERASTVRKFCRRLVHPLNGSDWFGWFITLCIIVSSAVLSYETPLNRQNNLKTALLSYTGPRGLSLEDLNLDSPDNDVQAILTSSEFLSNFYYISEGIFTAIFTAEFFIKALSDGVIMAPNAYFLSGWNCLDFVVLTCMWVGLFMTSVGSTGFPRLVRVFRAVRPLRLIHQFKGLRSVLDLLIESLRQIADSIILAMFFMFPYAVYGVVLFKNQFYSCNDLSVPDRQACTGTFLHPSHGFLMPRVWKMTGGGFQNSALGMLSLFEMIMEEGWLNIMFSAMKSRGNDLQPVWPPASYAASLYFLFWMMIGYVLLRNLFVGVILQAFMTRNGTALLTTEQRIWLQMQRQLKLVKPSRKAEPPTSDYFGFNTMCYRLTCEKYGRFHYAGLAVIMLNVALIMMDVQSYDKSNSSGQWIVINESKSLSIGKGILHWVFSLMYLLEFVVKISGLGVSKWRKSIWNIYDFVVLILLLPTALLRLSRRNPQMNLQYEIFQLHKLVTNLITIKLLGRVDLLRKMFKTIV